MLLGLIRYFPAGGATGGKQSVWRQEGRGGGGDYETGKKILNLRDIRGAFEEISKGGRERQL